MRRLFSNKLVIVYLLSTVIFVTVETVLGVALQKNGGREGAFYSMLAVVLAFLFHFCFFEKSKDYLFTQIALLFTVLADYFLVWVEPRVKLPAMGFFLVVQLCYAARLICSNENRAFRKIQCVCHFAASLLIVFVTVSVLGKDCDLLALVSMVYYANLALNLIFAFIGFRKHALLALGLLFFIGCDTCVGISLIDGYLPIAADSPVYRVLYPGFDMVWALYLPAQILLSLSLLPKRFKRLLKS
jgi:hypothetical protein